MKSKERLIIFYKNPELGLVKTRLAATVGDEMALAVYYRLAAHTRHVTDDLAIDRVVYYSSTIDFEDEWTNAAKALQHGVDLGERMLKAFEESFSMGYEHVCIIGTDCWQLQTGHVIEAFEKLRAHDVVVGPATDGGYYLLGMNRVYTQLFKNKTWSSSKVFKDTQADLSVLRLKYFLLPKLSDVDEEKDLPKNWRDLLD